jgi:hypothetical protein
MFVIRFCCLLYDKDELHFSIKRAQTPVFYVSVITVFSPSPRMCLQFYILFNMNVLIYNQRV